MRLRKSNNSNTFSDRLLSIDCRTLNTPYDLAASIDVLLHMCAIDENDLINSVYNSMSLDGTVPSPNYFKDRAILAPGNDNVCLLNLNICQCHPGEQHIYHSTDTYTIESDLGEDNQDIPLEFLHKAGVIRN
jgi:hypothetical protein